MNERFVLQVIGVMHVKTEHVSREVDILVLFGSKYSERRTYAKQFEYHGSYHIMR